MLPKIVSYARPAFRDHRAEAREELVEEVVANACVAFKALWDRGRQDIAYPTVLANYGIRQVREGRRVGASLNIKDVLSPYCQRRKNVTVERLDHFDEEENAWCEVLVEDKTAGPAAIAACRLDFAAWLRSLPSKLRKIAKVLASGETTGSVARRFDVSAGRISQIHAELTLAWERFQGEQPSPATA
jgi:hypothetical protein